MSEQWPPRTAGGEVVNLALRWFVFLPAGIVFSFSIILVADVYKLSGFGVLVFFGGCFLGILIVLAAVQMVWESVRPAVRKRKISAKKIGKKLRACESCLYLRPFFIDDNLKASIVYRSSKAYTRQKIPLIEYVQKYINPYSIFYLSPDAAFENKKVRIASNEEWMDVVLYYIENASCVFIVPYLGSGVGWEMDMIHARNLWRKVVIIIPGDEPPEFVRRYPSSSPYSMNDDSTGNAREFWEKSSSVMARYGITIPPFQIGGAFLTVSGNRVGIVSGLYDYPDNLKKSIKNMEYLFHEQRKTAAN